MRNWWVEGRWGMVCKGTYRGGGCARSAVLILGANRCLRCCGAASVRQASWKRSLSLRRSGGRVDLNASCAVCSCPSLRSRFQPVRGNARSSCSLDLRCGGRQPHQTAQSRGMTKSRHRCHNETYIYSRCEGTESVFRGVESIHPRVDPQYCRLGHEADDSASTLPCSWTHLGYSMVSLGT